MLSIDPQRRRQTADSRRFQGVGREGWDFGGPRICSPRWSVFIVRHLSGNIAGPYSTYFWSFSRQTQSDRSVFGGRSVNGGFDDRIVRGRCRCQSTISIIIWNRIDRFETRCTFCLLNPWSTAFSVFISYARFYLNRLVVASTAGRYTMLRTHKRVVH